MPPTFNPEESFVEEVAPRFDPGQPFTDESSAPRRDYKKQISDARVAGDSELAKANRYAIAENVARALDPLTAARNVFDYFQGVGKQAVDSALGYGKSGDFIKALSGEPVAGAIRADTPLIGEVAAATPEDFHATYGVGKSTSEVLSGLSEGAAGLVNFLQTAEGVFMLGTGKLPPPARAVAASYIAGNIAGHSPQIIDEFSQAAQSGDKAGMAKAAFDAIVTVGGAAGMMKVGAPEVSRVPKIPEENPFAITGRSGTIDKLALAEEAQRQAESGSPFTRSAAPVEPINAGLTIAPDDFEPSGLNLIPRTTAAFEAAGITDVPSIMEATEATGAATRQLREIAAEEARKRDFPKAAERRTLEEQAERARDFDEAAVQREQANQYLIDQKAAQDKAIADKAVVEEAKTIHPYKPLTENQLRLVANELRIAMDANPLRERPAPVYETAAVEPQKPSPPKEPVPGQRPEIIPPESPTAEPPIPGERADPMAGSTGQSTGLIAGSKLETWADDVLRGGHVGSGGEAIAAYIVKGTAIIERGVTDFAKWSVEMVRNYGPTIKSKLRQIYDESVKLRSGAFTKTSSSEIQVVGQPSGTKQTLPTRDNTPTAPAPDWRVMVPERQEGVAPYFQLSNPRATEQSGAISVESLRAAGHDVPDFTKLGKGDYSYADAIRLLNEESPSSTTKPTSSKSEKLDDIYKIFEPSKKTGTPLGERVTSIVEAVRTGLSSKFRPLDKLAEDISKAYGTVSRKGIAGIFEQLKGSSGRGEADVYRFDQAVSSLVKGSEKDFNAYIFLRRSLDRLEQDAATGEGRRKVAGYDIDTLQSKLNTLKSNLGGAKLTAFKQAADLYQQHMDAALKLQVDSGRMSQEVYDLIKSGNQFYAPFKVMKYIEETSRPPGTGQRVDTTADFTKAMTGIEDPNFKLGDMLGAARQSLLLSRILADKNNAMRRIAELATHDTEGRFIKRLDDAEEVPTGWEAVNVFEDGKQVRYATNPDVAGALQIFGDAGGDIVSRTLSAFSVPFRAGATALNLPFQVSNLLADVPRQALVSRYGLGFDNFLIYPFRFIESLYSGIAGDVFGSKNKLFLDFLDSGVAGVTVQEHLTPNALRFQEPTTISKSKQMAQTVLYTIPRFAAAIEQTSKVLGVKNAMKYHGVESGAELASKFPEAITELRRFSGSPDFGRQGKWTEQARLNLLYMFFNARVQGAVADVGRLSGRDGTSTAAKTWFKVGTAVGLPTAYLYSLNNSKEFKDDYAQRPEQEKNNYWLIPKDSFITNDQGEKMRDYWRIPKRESAKWIANATESALNFADQKDPEVFGKWMVKMLEDISPVNIQGKTLTERAESVGASLNPVIKAPLEAATGRDLYRHRNIVPDSQKKASPEQQYTDRTSEVFKKLADAMPDVAPEVFRSPLMLENMTRNLTAGLITQFLPSKPVEGRGGLANKALMQRFQAAPYTDQSKFREEMAGLEREAADEYLKRHRTATKLIADNKGKSLDKIVPAAGKDIKLIRHVVDLWLAEKNEITGQERQLLALPVTQRAEFISGQLKSMTPDQKKAAIVNYARKRILTEGVAAQMAEALK